MSAHYRNRKASGAAGTLLGFAALPFVLALILVAYPTLYLSLIHI